MDRREAEAVGDELLEPLHGRAPGAPASTPARACCSSSRSSSLVGDIERRERSPATARRRARLSGRSRAAARAPARLAATSSASGRPSGSRARPGRRSARPRSAQLAPRRGSGRRRRPRGRPRPGRRQTRQSSSVRLRQARRSLAGVVERPARRTRRPVRASGPSARGRPARAPVGGERANSRASASSEQGHRLHHLPEHPDHAADDAHLARADRLHRRRSRAAGARGRPP